LRVIAGKARGHKLRKVPGDTTRPITDRVKENLFNILAEWVIGTSWLDLFAGTGQVGIEALSRGADRGVFIDREGLAIRTIKENLRHTKLADKALVIQRDAFSYLNEKPLKPFDVIYVAPPQYKELWIDAINEIDRGSADLLTESGIAIAQIDPSEYTDLELSKLRIYDQRRYGRTMLCFYEVFSVIPE
jgi:16S rRNA (guanine(966)-N(2))-methyltransferase RsmD